MTEQVPSPFSTMGDTTRSTTLTAGASNDDDDGILMFMFLMVYFLNEECRRLQEGNEDALTEEQLARMRWNGE